MAKVLVPDQFPAGLRVIVVDDDVVCLKVLEQMLQRCAYNVTSCALATTALNLLREKKGCFDLVLSDVHMPGIDGFKLLEQVGLEMDLPVIMMSGDGRTSTVLRGIRHGACDFLVKPVREEELKNIWQHVVRKMWNGNKEHENLGSLDENDKNRHKRRCDDVEYTSSVSEGSDGVTKSRKKKKDAKDDDDDELENEDPAASKKPRVVWSVELHQQFVSAVNHLGIDKAVPKRILELMNVPGLTRENVASHLQKFRLYLKRLSGVAEQHHSKVPTSLCGPVDQHQKLRSLGRFSIEALTASGQIPPETLNTLQADLLGQPIDRLPLLQATLQGPKCTALNPRVSYGQSLMKCPSDKISKQSVSNDNVRAGFMWPSNNLSVARPVSNMLPNQQQQRHKQSIVPDPGPLINVQPSCVVIPSQSTASFQSGSSPGLVSHNKGFSASSVIDYSLVTSQSTSVFNGYLGIGSNSPSVSSCSVNSDAGASTGLKVQNVAPAFSASRQVPAQLPIISNTQGSYSGNSSQVLDQERLKSLGFVGKGMKSIPSRFAVDEIEFPISNLNQQMSCGEESNVKKVKQEPNAIDGSKMRTSMFHHFPNNFMSVFSE